MASENKFNIISHNGPSFRAYNSGGTFTVAAGVNKLVLNAEDLDSTSSFDSATNYRWTPLVSGWYLVGGTVNIATGVTENYIVLMVYKNGNRECDLGAPSFGTTTAANAAGAALVFLNGSTDYIEFYTFNSTGGNYTANGVSGSTRYSHAWGIFVKP